MNHRYREAYQKNFYQIFMYNLAVLSELLLINWHANWIFYVSLM
jgi:hypothetical protein